MKRNINVINNQIQKPINGFDSVSVDSTNNIVDCSVDNILYFCIENIEKNKAKTIFDTLVKKIRPKGSIVIRFCDLKKLCSDYNNNIISNTDLINKIKSVANPLSVDEILTYINVNNTKITNISRESADIIVTVTKVNL